MVKLVRKNINNLEKISVNLTNWVGTPYSVIFHTLLFIGIFALHFFGVTFDKILLILTTAVSLEAIYLAIFIQMTVNRNTKSLEEVEQDLDELQEDVEDIEEDVEDISEDIEEEDSQDAKTRQVLQNIQEEIKNLQQDLNQLKKSGVM